MPSLADLLGSIVPLLLFGVVCYVVYTVQSKISNSVTETKAQLASKGVTYDKNGLSIKTDKRAWDSEEYITNSSQAALNMSKRAMNSQAISFGAAPGSSSAESSARQGARGTTLH